MKTKLVIAYPFGGRPVPCDWHLAVRQMHLPTNSSCVDIFRRNMTLEDAQTSMVQQALDLDAQYIMFIEDDTQPPPNAIGLLMQTMDSDDSVMACGGIYTTRANPPEPVVYMGPGQGSFWKWKVGDLFECWSIGFGCLMIRMEVFKRMSKPWFKNLDTMEQVKQFPELFPEIIASKARRVGVSTDIFFFTKFQKLGMKVLAHGGVLPVHWSPDGKSYWLPVDSYPTAGVVMGGKKYGWIDPDVETPPVGRNLTLALSEA